MSENNQRKKLKKTHKIFYKITVSIKILNMQRLLLQFLNILHFF